MRLSTLHQSFAFLFAFAGLAIVPAAQASNIEVGQPAPDFTAKDLSGSPHSLSEYRGKTVVLEWNNPGCPFVQKQYNSGNMQNLQHEFTQRGVIWLTVNSTNPNHPDFRTPDSQKLWNVQQKASPTAYLQDSNGAIGRLYGARTTPQMFVIDAHGMLVYAGAIDDKRSTDVADVKTAKNYVAEALGEVFAG